MPRISEERGPSLFDELRDRLRIDKHELDTAWVELPDLSFRVGEQEQMAISKRDEFKLELNNDIAALDATLRQEAGDKKITEKAIEQQINDSVKIIDKRLQLARMTARVGEWQVLKEAYRERSGALKGLSSLHASNYFVTNNGSPYRREAEDRKAADIRAAAGEQRRQRPQSSRDRE